MHEVKISGEMFWIEQFLELQANEERLRELDRLAGWVYPRLLWGGWADDGTPMTALKQADIMLKVIGR